MTKVIGISREHEIILDTYLLTVCESIKDIASESRYNSFLDVIDIIIAYHNQYSNENLGTYSDFMSIIPTNVTSCFNGFIAGVENQKNRAKCRAYKILLTELSHNIISDLENLQLGKD